MNSEDFQIQGLNLHILETNKYKTNSIVFYFKRPLSKNEVSLNALIPYILINRLGEKLYKELENMYGAELNINIFKKGYYHIISLNMEVVNEKFLKGASNLLFQSLNIIKKILLDPYHENAEFENNVLEQVINSHRLRLSSQYDNPIFYANKRFFDYLYCKEPFSIDPLGYIEDLEGITPTNLYEFYLQMLSSSELDLYILGDIEDSMKLYEYVKDLFKFPLKSQVKKINYSTKILIDEKKHVENKKGLQDCKLHLGYRTGIHFGDSEYFSIEIFNLILGGSSGSLLSNVIRKEKGLVYYIGSVYEKHLGDIFIMTGVQYEKQQIVIELIKEQVQKIKNGKINKELFNETKENSISKIKALLDTPLSTIDLYYNNKISGTNIDVEHLIDGYRNVKLNSLIINANKVLLDTIYLLVPNFMQ